MKFHFLLNKSLLVILKIALYSTLFFIIDRFLKLASSNAPYYLAFGLTLLIIIIFQVEITQSLQNFIDRNFFKKLYQFKLELLEFNQQLNTILDTEVLRETIHRFFTTAFQENIYVFYLYKESNFEVFEYSSRFSIPVKIIEIDQKDFSCSLFSDTVELYTLKAVWDRYPSCRCLIEPYRGLLHYIIPLNSFKDIVGFLLFDKSIRFYLSFPETRSFLLKTLGKMSNVLENSRIHSEIKRQSLESELLLEIGKKITATLNLQEVLESIVNSLSRLVSCNAAGLFLVDKQHKLLRHMATRGYDRNLLDKIPLKLDQGISGEVIRTGKAVINPDVKQNGHYYEIRTQTKSQITVPIFRRNDVIGVIALESDEINHFTQSDLELLTAFSSLATIAINNAQLYEDSRKKKRLESDLLVASSVQRALLPERAPSIPGVLTEALNIPTHIVGGDLYDVFHLNSDQLGLAIGDVSGKGAPGAILMAILYAGFKSLLKGIYPVVEVVARLNNLLVEATMDGYYATFFYGVLDRQNKTITYCNAGHNAPILIRKDKTTKFLEKGGTVLGFLPNQSYHQETLVLEPGDYLILYTDGVTELRNRSGQEFGEKRLIRLLKKHYGKTPREIKNEILKHLTKFGGKQDFPDDITLLIIKIE